MKSRTDFSFDVSVPETRARARLRDEAGSARRAETDVLRNAARRVATVVRTDVGRGRERAQHVGVDRDLELLRRVVRPCRHLVDVGLDGHHVIEGDVEVLALVDEQFDHVRTRTLHGQVLVDLVVRDRDRRTRADDDLVALTLDLTLVVGVRDRGQNGGVVELFEQFAGPDFRDERARVGRGRVATRPRRSCNWVHGGLLRRN